MEKESQLTKPKWEIEYSLQKAPIYAIQLWLIITEVQLLNKGLLVKKYTI